MNALLDFLENFPTEEEEYDATIERIAQMNALIEPVPLEGADKFMMAHDFDPETNLYNPEVRRAQKTSLHISPDIISAVSPTTQTIGGYISNVQFVETDFTNIIHATPSIVMISSNYGRVVYPGYIPPEEIKTKNKTRQEEKKRLRKRNGDGSQMSSQISFAVRAGREPDEFYPLVNGYRIIPSNIHLHKIKTFRNGYAQIPGAVPETIEDIIRALDLVVEHLNKYLHGGQPVAKVLNINPVMFNYKFKFLVPSGAIFDNIGLGELMKVIKYDDADYPPVFLVNNDPSSRSVSVRFKIQPDITHTLPLMLFKEGKCNVQGGLNIPHIEAAIEYLTRVARDNYDRVFVKQYAPATLITTNVVSDFIPADPWK